jgi:hypothetical protein
MQAPIKRRPKARKPINPVVAVLTGVAIVGGCLIAGLIYFVANDRLTALNNQKKGRSSANEPKVSESLPARDRVKTSGNKAPADSATRPVPSPLRELDKPADTAKAPKATPRVVRAKPYDDARLAKDIDEIERQSKTVKTPYQSRGVAEKAIVLADRAVVLGNAKTARNAAVLTLAAARRANSLWIARRATILLLQLQGPLSDAVKQNARNRLGSLMEDAPAELPAAVDVASSGPSIRDEVQSPQVAAAPGSQDARWGKTEAERRKVFFDLLKAVDEYGMTPDGRKAWKDIQSRNGIDTRVTLGILNEGFGAFSDWEQPNGGGRASTRMNRMEWVGKRTRTMTEPMLQE